MRHDKGRSLRTILTEYYIQISIVIFTTLLIILSFNGLLHFYFRKRPLMKEPIEENSLVEKKHPSIRKNLSEQGIVDPQALLKETYSGGLIYEAFTGFRERPRSGKWVNVDPNGFRWNDTGNEWPPNPGFKNIFFFGGSTTFGYGAADHQTIPAYVLKLLNKHKNIRIYNFGRAGYYSTQERILFEQLLMAGHNFFAVVFIDGLNDFHYVDEPLLQHDSMKDFWNRDFEKLCQPQLGQEALKIPLVRFAAAINRRFLPNLSSKHSDIASDPDALNDPEKITRVVERYKWNKRMIEILAQNQNIKTLFVMQPVPTYAYDLKYHQYTHYGFGRHALSGYGYPHIKHFWKNGDFGKNFLWLGEAALHWTQPVYSDLVHYTPAFNESLAQKIADRLKNYF